MHADVLADLPLWLRLPLLMSWDWHQVWWLMSSSCRQIVSHCLHHPLDFGFMMLWVGILFCHMWWQRGLIRFVFCFCIFTLSLVNFYRLRLQSAVTKTQHLSGHTNFCSSSGVMVWHVLKLAPWFHCARLYYLALFRPPCGFISLLSDCVYFIIFPWFLCFYYGWVGYVIQLFRLLSILSVFIIHISHFVWSWSSSVLLYKSTGCAVLDSLARFVLGRFTPAAFHFRSEKDPALFPLESRFWVASVVQSVWLLFKRQ